MPSGGKPELLARIDSLFDFLLIEVSPSHGGYQVGPKVFQRWMVGCPHEIFLKAGVEGHELMDQVCHLHELEIVLECGVAFARILMFHAVTAVLQGVETLVLDFPAQATDLTGADNVAVIDGQICNVGKSGDFGFCTWHIRIGGADSLNTLQVIQGMIVVIDTCHPLEFLLNGFTARQQALFTADVARLRGGERIGSMPDAGQIAVLEGNAIGPLIGLLDFGQTSSEFLTRTPAEVRVRRTS